MYQPYNRYVLGTDRFTDFKLGENYLNTARNMWHVFKVIRSNRPEIEMWHISLYSEKNTCKRRVIDKLLLSVKSLRNRDCRIQTKLQFPPSLVDIYFRYGLSYYVDFCIHRPQNSMYAWH